MKKVIALAAVAVALAATPAFAAKDGKLSKNDSVGKLDVTAVIPPMVRISGLEDLKVNVTPADLTNPYFSRQDTETKFCVYSNINAVGDYNIKVDGDSAAAGGANGPYTLNGAGGNLDYNVWVSDDIAQSFGPGGSGYMFPGYTKTGYNSSASTGTRPTTIDCTDTGENSVLHIGINNAAILAAQAGKYKGTLTVTVSTL